MPVFKYEKDGVQYEVEGSSPEDADKKFLSAFPAQPKAASNLPDDPKDVGILDTVKYGLSNIEGPAAAVGLARGGASMIGQAFGGAAGALKGLISPKETMLGEAERMGKSWGEGAKNLIPPIFSNTEQVEKTLLEPAFDKLRDVSGQSFEAMNALGTSPAQSAITQLRRSRMTPLERMQEDAIARGIGEVGSDVGGVAGMGLGVRRGIRDIQEGSRRRTANRDAADAALEAQTNKPTENTLDRLLSEIEKEELARQGGNVRPDIPKNIPKPPTPERVPEYWPEERRIPYEREVSDSIPPDVIEGPPRPAGGVFERTRSGRDMLEQPIDPRQRQFQFEEPTLAPEIQQRPRGLEQLELPLLDETALARRERQMNETFAQREAEAAARSREIPSVDEAFRRQDYVRGVEERFTGPEPRRPDFEVSPVEQRLLGLENQSRILEQTINKALPPRSQRGAIMTEAITEGISNLINRVKRNEKKDTETRARIRDINQSDRDFLSSIRGENRNWEQHLRDDSGGKVIDLPSSIDLRERGASLGKRAQKKFEVMAADAAAKWADPGSLEKWTQNPHVKYVTERARSIFSRWNNVADLAKEGIRTESITRIPGKIIDPDSPSSRWNSLSVKERTQAANVINDINSRPREINKQELISQGYGQKAIDYAESVQKRLKFILDEVNSKLTSLGMKPITESPWYLTKYFGEGRYQFRIFDKATGKRLYFHKFNDIKEGRAYLESHVNKLKEKFGGDYEIAMEYERPKAAGERWNIAPNVISDIEAALRKDDPRRAVLENIDRDILAQANRAGGHTKRRTGVPGGEVSWKDAHKAYENYVDQLTAYARNVELKKMADEIGTHPETPKSNSQLTSWIQDYINRQMGGSREGPKSVKMLEDWFDEHAALHKVGGSRNIVRLANKAASNGLLMFMNLKHGAAQWRQSIISSPPGILLYAENYGTKGSAYGATYSALNDILLNNYSKDQRKFLQWEANRGSIDPTFTMELSSISRKADWFTDYVMMSKIPKAGEKFGRVHSSLAAYNYLYENGLRGQKLWTEAERISRDYVMGDYSEQGRIAAIQRGGIIGESARPFSTYYNFWLNTTLQMLNAGFTRGNFKPLAAYWVNTTLAAGLIGAPFISGFSTIYDELKKMKWFQEATGVNENSPKLEDLVIQNMPDAAAFGVLDASLGVRMSDAVSSPAMHFPGENAYEPFLRAMSPGLTYGYDSIKGIVEWSNDRMRKLLTDIPTMSRGERMRALKEAFPGAMVDAMIDNWDTVGLEKIAEQSLGLPDTWFSGQDKYSLVGKHGKGGYDRSEPFDVVASIVGSGSLREKRQRVSSQQQFEREKEVADDKSRVITLLAEVSSGKETMSDEAFNRLAEKAVRLGQDPKTLVRAIEDRVKELETSKTEQDVGKGRTSRQQRRMLDQILLEEAGN